MACCTSDPAAHGLGRLVQVAVVCLVSSLNASPLLALDPRQKLDQLHHTSWTAKDGLPGAVLTLALAADGFLWIGTTDGLFRFDGVSFEPYQPDEGALHATAISALMAVPDRGLWVGYLRGGASVIANGRVVTYTARDGLPIGAVRSLAQDHDGTMWVATVGGLARLERGRWRIVRAADWRYPCLSAWGLLVDRYGTLWVGGASPDHLMRLPKGSRAFEAVDMQTPVSTFAEAPDGHVWFIDDVRAAVRVLRAGVVRRTIASVEGDLSAGSLLFDRDGALWLGGSNVSRVSWPDEHGSQDSGGALREIETFTQDQGLTGSLVGAMLQDREGNIWVGTEGGLDRLRARNLSWWQLYRHSAQIGLVAGDRSDLWAFAFAAPSLVRVQDGAVVRGAPDDISLAYRDPEGAIWLSAKDSFWRLRDGVLSTIAPPEQVQARRVPFKVMSATADRAGGLWLSVNGLGEFYRKDGVWTFSTILEERPDLTAIAALTDASDRIWLLYPDTLAVLDHGTVRRFSADATAVDVGALLTMAQDGDRIWVGGETGLAFLERDRFRTIRVAGASRLGPISGIVVRAHDGLWLSAGPGIVHVPEPEIQNAIHDPSRPVSYELFDLTSDLPESLQRRRSGLGFTSIVQGSDDQLWFATARGVVRMDPARLLKNPLPPPVVIRSVWADDVRYAISDRVTLPARTRSLRVDYTALSLSIPERVRFRFRLDGWDTEWHDAGSQRSAFYTQLAPGPYVFRVIASNNDGVWNDVGATVSFSIAPAWFQTAWFRSAIAGALTIVLWSLYRLRMRQVAAALSARFDERLAERTRIARDLHDTLLQTVQASKMVVDDAVDQPDDPVLMRTLQQLAGWLARAVHEGRSALNSLRTATTDTIDLDEALRRAIEVAMKPASLTMTLTIGGCRQDLHPIVRDEIYRIACEAIVNTCQHSAASDVQVRLEYGHDLTLSVTDNGIGIDTALVTQNRAGHYGLQGMRERAARINARLTTVSTAHAGTIVTLVVPGGVVYRAAPPFTAIHS